MVIAAVLMLEYENSLFPHSVSSHHAREKGIQTRGTSLCVIPKGMMFERFWFEKGYKL